MVEYEGGVPFAIPPMNMICPFGCDNKDPALAINLQKNLWQCKRCRRMWARITTNVPLPGGFILVAEQIEKNTSTES